MGSLRRFLVVSTESNQNGTITHSYGQWGRETGYQVAAGGQVDAATTTYNTLGRISTISDNNGSTTYVYDGTDATGKTERRGLLTAVTVTTQGKSWTSTGAYDPQGVLTVEKFPGGIIKRTTCDTAGELVDLTWNGPAVQPDNTILSDQPWIAWSSRTDPAGRVVREWMPNGQLGTTGELGATVIASDRSYSYDPAGRLTTVTDITGNPDPDTHVPCTLRTYSFDNNGNRTSQTSATADTCPTTGGTRLTRTYDTADRPVTGANGDGVYIYDPLGRQTIIPAADAPHPSGCDLQLGYYDNDAAATITQGEVTIGYSLDAGMRRKTQTTTDSAGVTSSLTNHYTAGGDSPTWISEVNADNPAMVEVSRFGTSPSGGLALTITGGAGEVTAVLAIAGLRGAICGHVTLPAGATEPGGVAAEGLDDWSSFDENGATTTSSSSGNTYGWLGNSQRSRTTVDIFLMGARLYNPSTGMFTSLDLMAGANETRLGYPNDPINSADVSGRNPALVIALGVTAEVVATLVIVLGVVLAGVAILALGEQLASAGAWDRVKMVARTAVNVFGVGSRVAKVRATSYRSGMRYRLYEILYQHKGRVKTWKYGITSVGEGRPLKGVSVCATALGLDAHCRFKWRGTRVGYFEPRLWEYGNIAAYWLTHGTCPSGQDKAICR